MPQRLSAGLLLYRHREHAALVVLEMLLGHMGGPFWAHKDAGAWSIPKGEYESDDDPFAAAQREFEEELGAPPPHAEYRELGTVRQSGGKLVTVWAAEADFDVTDVVSNTFDVEWPPGSGRMQSFPEIDKAGWFDPAVARVKLVKSQHAFVDRLVALTDGLA